MADEAKQTFPKIPAKHWWAIREKFKTALPKSVTPTYLETTLGIRKETANEIIRSLQIMKIIDDNATPTDRGESWRHDEDYTNVCKDIREEIYPRELLDAVTDASNREAAERWFAKTARVGQNAALQMAIPYQFLLEADVSKKGETTKGNNKPQKQVRPNTPKQLDQQKAKEVLHSQQSSKPQEPSIQQISTASSDMPSLHIDVQIHISSDMTSEQIDQIFASMAKHLYKRDSK